MGGSCSTYGGSRYVYKVMLGTPKGKRPLRGPNCSWVHNMKMDIQNVGWGMDWIYLAQDKERKHTFVDQEMNLRVLYNAGNFFSN